ncbi:MAG: glutamate--tRNA ligase [Alphaproteobacteria bacterium]|nr:glutamate--tRNA ligase [Alphaproteobacteria bacterium]
MSINVRFAPSPTGYLHIGGARTALFNYLFAKHNKGNFLVRIEDTDKARSTQEAVNAIKQGLDWLGLSPDSEYIFQSDNIEKHKEVVKKLLDSGKAYYCYTTPEELSQMREEAQKQGIQFKYPHIWRDSKETPPKDVKPVVRIKLPKTGETVINDLVQGQVTVANEQLDDFILLRSDGSPTYMLSVVVDDIDMNISHIIRGDDHLNNAFRQYHLFKAIGVDIPKFAHIPLIYGEDGKKLSKRHGALGVEQYQKMGYLADALKNYLCRLGWSHGDNEIFTQQQAIEWFDLKNVGKSPSRMDFKKLENLNASYIKQMDNQELLNIIIPMFGKIDDIAIKRIEKGIDSIKSRATTVNDFTTLCDFYVNRPSFPLSDEKTQKLIKQNSPDILENVANVIKDIDEWSEQNIENTIKLFIEKNNFKFAEVAQPIRATISGTTKSPGIFEIINILGKQETIERLTKLSKNKTDS